MQRFFVVYLVFFIVSWIPAEAKILDDTIPSGRNYDKAVFRLWYPDSLIQIRGVVVMVPGSNADGRSLVNSAAWQELSRRNGLALLGCYFTDSGHPDPAIEYYVKVSEGSGQALLDVLVRFARKSGHRELGAAPLLLWGHSAGGQFNYEFVSWKPERVLAFVVNKGGIYYTAITEAETRKVPGIFFTGQKDLEYRIDIVKGIFAVNRRFGALWTFAEEPGAGHEVGETERLTIDYFNQIIPLRLEPEESSSSKNPGLREVREDSGFVGDPKTKKVVPFAEWQKTTYPTAWLPTQDFSQKWLAFISG